MITITRKFEWDAGHRVLGHEGKCRHIHGHRYVAEVTVAGPYLDELGRVIDFSLLKTVVGKWIDDNWDHNFLCHPEDPILRAQVDVSGGDDSVGPLELDDTPIWQGKSPYIMFSPDNSEAMNPTAENMAIVLYEKASLLLIPHKITVVRVRLWETPNCDSVYEPSLDGSR